MGKHQIGLGVLYGVAFLVCGLLAPAFAANAAATGGDAPTTNRPTATPTARNHATATHTPTAKRTDTATRTVTPTRTSTSTHTPTVTITPTATAVSAPLIIDNASPGFAKTGVWTATTLDPGYYGANYLSDNGTGKGSMTATFTAPIATTGLYQVSMFYPVSDASTSTNVPVTIVPAAPSGKSIIWINEQASGGTWIPLGTFYFDTTGGQFAEISNAGTTGTVVANAFSWTWVPSGGLPTPTATAVATPIPGLLAKLPLTYSILDSTIAAYFDLTAATTDVALVVADTNASQVLSSVTTGLPYWGNASWSNAQPQLTGLVRSNHIQGFAYDAEHWPATPLTEQNNMASTVKTAGQVLHGMGLQFWITPDTGFASATIEPMAENADVIILQVAQMETSPGDYASFVLPMVAQAKAANPAIKVYAKVDFLHGTPHQDLAALQSVETKIDGIDVYVADPDLALNLPTFQSLIAQN